MVSSMFTCNSQGNEIRNVSAIYFVVWINQDDDLVKAIRDTYFQLQLYSKQYLVCRADEKPNQKDSSRKKIEKGYLYDRK